MVFFTQCFASLMENPVGATTGQELQDLLTGTLEPQEGPGVRRGCVHWGNGGSHLRCKEERRRLEEGASVGLLEEVP